MLRWIMNLYPPYLGAGVWVRHISADFSEIKVEMPLRWYNRNYVRTHFGGSLYAMTDPFFMLMVMERLGRDYIVWDKAASIDFVAPGKGTVYADFRIDEALLDDIRQRTAGGEKYLPELQVEVLDAAGDVVARVHKTLYVRLKPQARQAG
ncbi:DUF4442 domain-containing protein [Pseudomonas sp. TTU2014-080ASC]|uniref:DUF4442 domain-containing protein n=1 Tax=Pseudomonas sp. TTU2014-080ASC TaxID=1729724 RepID=UPI0007188A31|nr:DUF4442 domain-containing protein [Pseudomonas sp. TTU2014-080ASC]KRW61714.1 tetrameric acyl-CoA thioesterase [Pseudomonas sp. TTU2014-080ASC]